MPAPPCRERLVQSSFELRHGRGKSAPQSRRRSFNRRCTTTLPKGRLYRSVSFLVLSPERAAGRFLGGVSRDDSVWSGEGLPQLTHGASDNSRKRHAAQATPWSRQKATCRGRFSSSSSCCSYISPRFGFKPITVSAKAKARVSTESSTHARLSIAGGKHCCHYTSS